MLIRVLLWLAAVAGLLFALVYLLGKAGAGFDSPVWVGAAGLFCLAVWAILIMIVGSEPVVVRR
jgi:hypothetical protein